MSNWHFLYEVSSVQEEVIVCKEFSATSHFLYPAFRIHSSLKMVLQSVYLGCATQAIPFFFFLQTNTWFYLYVRGVGWAIFKADQWTEWSGRASAIHDILSSLSEHCVPLPARHRCLCAMALLCCPIHFFPEVHFLPVAALFVSGHLWLCPSPQRMAPSLLQPTVCC